MLRLILIVSFLTISCGEQTASALKVGGLSIQAVPTISGMAVSSGGPCGTGMTSSIVPDKWGIPGKFASFESACREHDRCYDYQKGKDFCDGQFKEQLIKACKKTFNTVVFKLQQVECTNLITNMYYLLVKNAGKAAYEKCVDEKCLPEVNKTKTAEKNTSE